MIKNLNDKILKILSGIFKKSLETAYPAIKWRMMRVTFIPKPGKPAYNIPKAPDQ